MLVHANDFSLLARLYICLANKKTFCKFANPHPSFFFTNRELLSFAHRYVMPTSHSNMSCIDDQAPEERESELIAWSFLQIGIWRSYQGQILWSQSVCEEERKKKKQTHWHKNAYTYSSYGPHAIKNYYSFTGRLVLPVVLPLRPSLDHLLCLPSIAYHTPSSLAR